MLIACWVIAENSKHHCSFSGLLGLVDLIIVSLA